jgi:hypothetical protein
LPEQLRAESDRRNDAAEQLDELEQLGQRCLRLADPHQPPAASRFLSEGGEADQAPSRWGRWTRDQGAMPKETGEVPRPGGEAGLPLRHELSRDSCPTRCRADAGRLRVLHRAQD